MKKSLFAIFINLLYWIPRSYYLFFIQISGVIRLYNFGYLGISLCVFYLFYFLLVPRFFYKRKFVIFIIYSLLTVIVSSLLTFPVLRFISKTFVYYGKTDLYFHSYMIIQFIEVAAYSVIPAIGIRIFVDWFSEMHYKRQLERKNAETELALLKAQINPHFLFNTLNNIDVLIEKDSDTASVYLKKLSDILRFMLYESPSEIIPLTQELEYIRKYIELQKIRTSNSNYVTFQAEGDTGHIMIAPMLFIPFIENAFKHSVNKKIDHAIDVKLVAGQNGIVFECNNAYDPAALQTQPKSGLGLELIKNRLKLLYNDNYNLKIDKSDNRFIVNLTINGNQLHYN